MIVTKHLDGEAAWIMHEASLKLLEPNRGSAGTWPPSDYGIRARSTSSPLIHSARHVVFVQSNTNVTFARVTKSNWGPTGCNVQFDRVSDGPLTFRSVNTAREYAEQQSRKRTQEQFTKRTEQVKALISSAEHDPGVWKTQRSMANALGVSTSEINHMVKGGWVTKPKGASGYSPDLTKLDWTDESVESTNLGEGVPEF